MPVDGRDRQDGRFGLGSAVGLEPGLLVLDGLIVVELEAGRSRVGWLIVVEDLIRPWQLPEIAIATGPRWGALPETCIAVLDHRFYQRVATKLSLIDELLARAAETTHWLLARSLVLSAPSVEERLLLAYCANSLGLDLLSRTDPQSSRAGLRSQRSLVAQSPEAGMVDGSWMLAALARRGQLGSTI